MTSKQRAYLKGLAMTMDPIFQIGKSSLTPELTAAVAEALEARELIKLNILKNCVDDGNELAAYDEVKWNRFLYRTVRGLNSSPEQNVANLQFEYLREKAKAGDSFVVVGRCSETILREYKCLVSIFVGGDISKKAERVMKYYNMTEKEAREFMKEKETHSSLDHSGRGLHYRRSNRITFLPDRTNDTGRARLTKQALLVYEILFLTHFRSFSSRFFAFKSRRHVSLKNIISAIMRIVSNKL